MERVRRNLLSRSTLVVLFGLQACAGGALPDDDAEASLHEDSAREADATHALDVTALEDATTADGATPADGAANDAAHGGITAFTLLASDNHGLTANVNGTIHGTSIALTVPYGTSVTALTPTIAFTGTSLEPASGIVESFASPVAYTLTNDDGSTEMYSATVTVGPNCTATVASCDRSIYNRAHAYAEAYPTHNGGTWNQWCAALAYRFSNESHAAEPSAIAAYHASHIVSTDYHSARIGAFHFWSIGTFGHVGVDLLGGGTDVFMASNHITTVWGTSIGTNSVAGYSSSAGARYLGWSMDYNGSIVTGGGGAACTTATPLPTGCPLAHTATATSGVPDTDFWRLMQTYAAANGYTGPVNGVMGPNSWAGVQRGLRSAGYTGPDNGIPGVNTYAAMQRIAAMYGYTGPVNGILGPNSYKGFAAFLNAHYAG